MLQLLLDPAAVVAEVSFCCWCGFRLLLPVFLPLLLLRMSPHALCMEAARHRKLVAEREAAIERHKKEREAAAEGSNRRSTSSSRDSKYYRYEAVSSPAADQQQQQQDLLEDGGSLGSLLLQQQPEEGADDAGELLQRVLHFPPRETFVPLLLQPLLLLPCAAFVRCSKWLAAVPQQRCLRPGTQGISEHFRGALSCCVFAGGAVCCCPSGFAAGVQETARGPRAAALLLSGPLLHSAAGLRKGPVRPFISPGFSSLEAFETPWR